MVQIEKMSYYPHESYTMAGFDPVTNMQVDQIGRIFAYWPVKKCLHSLLKL
jgi:hypothetical protein